MNGIGLKHSSVVVYKYHISSLCWRTQLDKGLDDGWMDGWIVDGFLVVLPDSLVLHLRNCGKTCIYGHL